MCCTVVLLLRLLHQLSRRRQQRVHATGWHSGWPQLPIPIHIPVNAHMPFLSFPGHPFVLSGHMSLGPNA